jgi:hypothetical protein
MGIEGLGGGKGGGQRKAIAPRSRDRYENLDERHGPSNRSSCFVRVRETSARFNALRLVNIELYQ